MGSVPAVHCIVWQLFAGETDMLVIFETMFDKFSNTLLSRLKRRNKKATCFKIKLQEYLCSMQVGCKKKKIFCDNLSLKDFSSLTSSLSVELLSAGGSQ